MFLRIVYPARSTFGRNAAIYVKTSNAHHPITFRVIFYHPILCISESPYHDLGSERGIIAFLASGTCHKNREKKNERSMN